MSAGQARVIIPQRLSTRPGMAGSAAFCTRVWVEIPCTDPAAPMIAAQSRAKVKTPVATKPIVASACTPTAPTGWPGTSPGATG